MFISLFNNTQTLKFKAKVMITFYAAINNYRSGQQNGNKQNRLKIICNYNPGRSDLLNPLKYHITYVS